MFTVVAVDAKLEPLRRKTICPSYETAREEQIRMIRWNRQGGSVQTALPQLEEQVQEQNEWRILLVGDEDVIRTRNPFDIARSDQAADYARCAQMLGHIPPWITFHEEEGGLSSQIDMPQEQEREERRFTDPDQISPAGGDARNVRTSRRCAAYAMRMRSIQNSGIAAIIRPTAAFSR